MNTIITHIKTTRNYIKILAAVIFIVVLGTSIFLYIQYQNRNTLQKCHVIDDSTKKVLCWKSLVDEKLSQGKLDESMDLVGTLFDTEPDFAANCHDFMHSVGKTAYKLFSSGVRFKVGSKTSYCAYGFYHGFMENLVSQSGDITMARDFCAYVDKEISKNSSGAKLACYHGIGHGWTNTHDPAVYGNEQKMATPALALCEKVTQDPEELKICATGVFDSISIGYYNQLYGLKINKEDPYWLCRVQPLKYQIPCYMDLTPAVLWLGNYKLEDSLKYVSTVPSKYSDIVVSSISEDAVRFIVNNKYDLATQIKTCRSLPESKKILCIQGLTAGFLQFGPPKNEESYSLEFCNSEILTTDERGACYSKLITNVRAIFSEDRVQKICSNISDEYKKYCAK